MKTKLSIAVLWLIPSWAASISAHPEVIRLTGRNAGQTLVVSAGERDVTVQCSFELANPSLANVSAAGVVTALADGKTSLTQ